MLREIGRRDIQVIAHRDIFRLNFVTEPYLRHVGIMPGDSSEEIEKAGGSLLLTRDPVKLMSGITITGEVKRQTDFEEVGIALKTIDGGEVVDDQMLDDISVVANVNGKGLVIVTGCSHAGIVNIARHAMELTAGTGRRGTSYEARYNLILGQANSHSFDMHGGADRKDGTDIAGDWIRIHHNTFFATRIPAVVIRGRPTKGAEVHHNWFGHDGVGAAVRQTNANGNMRVYRNQFGPKRTVQD